MGSAQAQGDLWSVRAQEWADLQENSFRPLYEAAFNAAKVGTGTSVLDIGCGAGLALEMARQRGATVTGIDAAPGLTTIAAHRCPDGDIRIGDVEELPFVDRSFDVVTGFNSFQYAANPVQAVMQAYRVAKPGGAVIVAVWGAADKCQLAPYLGALGSCLPPPPPGASGPFALSAPGALEALVKQAGLKPVGVTVVSTTMRFPDEPTALRGLIASGVAERAIRHSGELAVRLSVAEAIRPSKRADGSYAFVNEWRFLTSRA